MLKSTNNAEGRVERKEREKQFICCAIFQSESPKRDPCISIKDTKSVDKIPNFADKS